MPHYTYRSEWTRCNKAGCGTCPHGPYWYRYWREAGKLRKEYVGKERDPLPPPPPSGDRPPAPDPLDAIFGRHTASAALAWRILGLAPGTDYLTARAWYRQQCLAHHPDRGGELKTMLRLNCAWEYLCSDPGFRHRG